MTLVRATIPRPILHTVYIYISFAVEYWYLAIQRTGKSAKSPTIIIGRDYGHLISPGQRTRRIANKETLTGAETKVACSKGEAERYVVKFVHFHREGRYLFILANSYIYLTPLHGS